MRTRRLRQAILLSLVVVGASLLGAGIAKAFTQTPWTCDGVPKYYCATIEYDNYGSYASVLDRWWKGARDGGAQRWQLYWLQDWSWDGSRWVFQRNFGQSGWNSNIDLSTAPWYSHQGYTITQPALINYKLRYYECDHMGLNCYYWCSPQLDHRLWDNTSAQIGQGC